MMVPDDDEQQLVQHLDQGTNNRRNGENSDSKNSDCENSEGDSDSSADNDGELEQIKDIFWNFRLERNGNDDEDLKTVLDVLRKRPELAAERFPHKPYSASATLPINPRTTSQGQIQLFPFTYFLIGGASSKILKQLHDMCQEIINKREVMPDRAFYSSIHIACQHRADEPNVIAFVAQRCQRKFFEEHIHSGYQERTPLPLEIAFDKYAPLETIRVLAEHGPSVLTQKDTPTNFDVLQRVLCPGSRQSRDVIDFVVEKIAASPKEEYDIRSSDGEAMDLARLEIVSPIVLQKHTLGCSFLLWRLDAWEKFLYYANANKSLVRLQLKLPSALAPGDTGHVTMALSIFLKTNKSIRTLYIRDASGNDFSCMPSIETIVGALESNKTLQNLTLSDFLIGARGSALTTVFSAPLLLKHVQFDRVNFTDSVTGLVLEGLSCASLIEKVDVTGCRFCSKSLCAVLNGLAVLPCLTHVNFSVMNANIRRTEGYRIPIGELLATILHRNVIKSLQITFIKWAESLQMFLRSWNGPVQSSIELDFSSLFRKVATNSSLETLSILCDDYQDVDLLIDSLEHHNTTLREVDFKLVESNLKPVQAARAAYFAGLNSSGRGRLQSPDLEFGDFIYTLFFALPAPSCHVDITKEAIVFGLLLESVSFWSSSRRKSSGLKARKSSRKRGREEA